MGETLAGHDRLSPKPATGGPGGRSVLVLDLDPARRRLIVVAVRQTAKRCGSTVRVGRVCRRLNHDADQVHDQVGVKTRS
jgi:hypothetical protein